MQSGRTIDNLSDQLNCTNHVNQEQLKVPRRSREKREFFVKDLQCTLKNLNALSSQNLVKEYSERFFEIARSFTQKRDGSFNSSKIACFKNCLKAIPENCSLDLVDAIFQVFSEHNKYPKKFFVSHEVGMLAIVEALGGNNEALVLRKCLSRAVNIDDHEQNHMAHLAYVQLIRSLDFRIMETELDARLNQINELSNEQIAKLYYNLDYYKSCLGANFSFDNVKLLLDAADAKRLASGEQASQGLDIFNSIRELSGLIDSGALAEFCEFWKKYTPTESYWISRISAVQFYSAKLKGDDFEVIDNLFKPLMELEEQASIVLKCIAERRLQLAEFELFNFILKQVREELAHSPEALDAKTINKVTMETMVIIARVFDDLDYVIQNRLHSKIVRALSTSLSNWHKSTSINQESRKVELLQSLLIPESIKSNATSIAAICNLFSCLSEKLYFKINRHVHNILQLNPDCLAEKFQNLIACAQCFEKISSNLCDNYPEIISQVVDCLSPEQTHKFTEFCLKNKPCIENIFDLFLNADHFTSSSLTEQIKKFNTYFKNPNQLTPEIINTFSRCLAVLKDPFIDQGLFEAYAELICLNPRGAEYIIKSFKSNNFYRKQIDFFLKIINLTPQQIKYFCEAFLDYSSQSEREAIVRDSKKIERRFAECLTNEIIPKDAISKIATMVHSCVLEREDNYLSRRDLAKFDEHWRGWAGRSLEPVINISSNQCFSLKAKTSNSEMVLKSKKNLDQAFLSNLKSSRFTAMHHRHYAEQIKLLEELSGVSFRKYDQQLNFFVAAINRVSDEKKQVSLLKSSTANLILLSGASLPDYSEGLLESLRYIDGCLAVLKHLKETLVAKGIKLKTIDLAYSNTVNLLTHERAKFQLKGADDVIKVQMIGTKNVLDTFYGALGECCALTYGLKLKKTNFQPIRLVDADRKESLGVLYALVGKVRGEKAMILAGFEPRKSFVNRISPSELVEKAVKELSLIACANGLSKHIYTNWPHVEFVNPPGNLRDDGRIAELQSIQNALKKQIIEVFRIPFYKTFQMVRFPHWLMSISDLARLC